MNPIRVPKLAVVLPVDMDASEIYAVFEAALEVAPLSKSEIAERLDVNQSTVSRWASGDARPSVEDMLRVLDIVEDRLAEIEARAERARSVLTAVDRAVELHDRYAETRERDDLARFDESIERLRTLLESD